MRKTSAISIFTISLMLCSYTIFEKKIGTSGCYDEGISVLNKADGSFIISGAYNCTGNSSGWESYLLKLNHDGDTLWSKKNLDINGIAKATKDNNLIFAGANKAGFINDTIKFFKATEDGILIWETTIFYPLCKNLATDIFESSDGFLITGIYASGSCSNPMFDSFIMKLDHNGKKVWEKIISGPGNDQLFQVRELPDGDVAAFGWTNSKTQNSDADFLLVKLDRDGNTIWEKTYGDADNNFGYGMDITEANGFVLTGYSDQTEILKLDNNGTVMWSKLYGQVCGGRYFKVKLSSDEGYVFIGSENQSGNCGSYLMKTDRSGEIAWKKIFPGKLRDFMEDQNGVFILIGYIDYLPDIYVVKFDSTRLEVSIPTSDGNVHFDDGILKVIVYPNPANDKIVVEFQNPDGNEYQLEVFDITGRMVISHTGNAAEKIEILKGNLTNGMFTFKLLMGEKVRCGKFLFQ